MFPRWAVSEFPNDNPELHDGLVWSCPAPCAPALPTLRLRARNGERPRVIGPAWESEGESELRHDDGGSSEAPESAAETTSGVEGSSVDEETERTPGFEETSAPGAEAEAAPSVLNVEEETAPNVGEAEAEAGTVASDLDETPPEAPICEPAPATPFAEFVAALSRVALERGATRVAALIPSFFDVERPAPLSFERPALEALKVRGLVEGDPARPSAAFLAVARAWRGVLEGTANDLSACGATALDAWGATVLQALLGLPRERSEELRRELRRRGVAAFGLLAVA